MPAPPRWPAAPGSSTQPRRGIPRFSLPPGTLLRAARVSHRSKFRLAGHETWRPFMTQRCPPPERRKGRQESEARSTSAVCLLFQKLTGTRFQFVPYRSSSQAMQDLVPGRIDWLIVVPTDAMPQLRSENIKAFAATASSRLATAPDIPTVDEAGLPGFYLSNWRGIWAPKRTPKTVIAKLNAAIVVVRAQRGKGFNKTSLLD
jgi:tripartite-type tricarboxylate transporter receptor subunit TctC